MASMQIVRDETWRDTFRRWRHELATQMSPLAWSVFVGIILMLMLLAAWLLEGCPAGGPW
jgi:hypothetical protein